MKLILGDSLDKLKELEDNSVDSIVSDPPYGLSFMGKKWDYDVPSVELWQEVIRVLKPGGHILCACGTRTQHRMAVNLEDAGFEIRDIVAWVYGSGFPKSLNIGKAIARVRGDEIKRGNLKFKGGSQLGVINDDSWEPKDVYEETVDNEWSGYGTALKPAMELWTLCRKPIKGTVASNVLEWGTGGLNIDGCRVGFEENDKPSAGNRTATFGTQETISGGDGSGGFEANTQGRFPANLIHDGSDEVVGLFPNSKGELHNKMSSGQSMFLPDNEGSKRGFSIKDSGSAARFFYCAKASKSERNKGLEGFELKHPSEVTGRKVGSAGAQNGGYAGMTETPRANVHPTVKPVSLMRYLCKLITPKGGTILDPFMGSGTTGIGAKLEGFDFIGIEREQDYLKIAQARIDAWEADNRLL